MTSSLAPFNCPSQVSLRLMWDFYKTHLGLNLDSDATAQREKAAPVKPTVESSQTPPGHMSNNIGMAMEMVMEEEGGRKGRAKRKEHFDLRDKGSEYFIAGGAVYGAIPRICP
jgi:hypothetical protein